MLSKFRPEPQAGCSVLSMDTSQESGVILLLSHTSLSFLNRSVKKVTHDTPDSSVLMSTRL